MKLDIQSIKVRKKHCSHCNRVMNYFNSYGLCFDCDPRKINQAVESV